jgi:hypothetical protein
MCGNGCARAAPHTDSAQHQRKPKPEPVEVAAEVVANGGEHSVDGVAGGVRQVISVHGGWPGASE